MDFFRDRSLAIATRHQKERVLAPVLEEGLGLRCLHIPDIDTDQLGTFTGEVERRLTPLAAAREKCRLALEWSGLDLAVASEGSFGPHPVIPFVAADEELLLLVDQKHALEVAITHYSHRTNYARADVTSEDVLLQFAQQAGFPSHGLILRPSPTHYQDLRKGIVTEEDLLEGFQQLRSAYSTVHVETDMRAMYNPTRMEVIQEAAWKLVQRCRSQCPSCSCPGFGIQRAETGLPCSVCGSPTRSVLAHVYQCAACGHSLQSWFPNQIREEDPGRCDFCNP